MSDDSLRAASAKVSTSDMAIYRQPFSDGCNLLDSNSLSHWGPEALEGKPLC